MGLQKSVFVQIKGYTPFLWENEKEIWKMKNLFSRTTANSIKLDAKLFFAEGNINLF